MNPFSTTQPVAAAPGAAVGAPRAHGPRATLSRLVAGANGKARPAPSGRLAQLFAEAGCRPLVAERFRQEEKLGPSRLDAVLRSLTYLGPALSPAALSALLDEARRLAAAHGGAVWKREITLTWARAR